MTEFKSIGHSEKRKDALDKVTGAAMYTADIHPQGMLYGKLFTSPVAHAKIIKVDVSEAEKLPGVVAVVTGEDAKNCGRAGFLQDRTVLSWDKVRYVGDAVAAVAAVSEEIAKKAVELIRFEYEKLPAVFDPMEAFDPDCSAVIHEDLQNYTKIEENGLVITLDEKHPNQYHHRKVQQGDVEEGFRDSDVIVEETYKFPQVSQGFLEPIAAMVIPEEDGGVSVYASEQQSYIQISEISNIFGIPASKVRFFNPYMGGGFGGKACISLTAIVVLLALKAKKPVQIVHTRAESFESGNPRSMAYVTVKDGFKKDGTLVARKLTAVVDGGAYASVALEMTSYGVHGAIGSYRQKHLKIDMYGAYTNTSPKGAYRSLGSEMLCFSIENNMDRASEILGIDPVKLRVMNLLKEGDLDGGGKVTHSNASIQALEGAAEEFGWDQPVKSPEGPWIYGKGVAVGNKVGYFGDSGTSARCKVREDGDIEIYVSHVELGQGALTVDAQSAAEEFNVPMEKVHITFGDTKLCPYDEGTYCSKGSFLNGRAVKMACQKTKQKMFEFTAEKFGVEKEYLYTEDSMIYSARNKDFRVHISELFQYGGWIECGELSETATYVCPNEAYDPETGQSEGFATFYSHGAWCVEIALNVETGEIRFERAVGKYDCGQVLNYDAAISQIEGSFSMGLAQAVYEECIFNGEGKIINNNFRDYRLPTFMDGPSKDNLKSGFTGALHKDGPWGSKGIGEVAMIPVLPAVAIAINNALGIKINQVPINFERVFTTLQEQKDKAVICV